MAIIINDNINIDKKLWLEILKDDITDQIVLDILKFLLDSKDYEEHAKTISEKLKFGNCNIYIKSFGNRIINKYPEINCPKYNNGKNAPSWIPFLKYFKNKFIYWKLRPELVEALKEYNTA